MTFSMNRKLALINSNNYRFVEIYIKRLRLVANRLKKYIEANEALDESIVNAVIPVCNGVVSGKITESIPIDEIPLK